MSAAGKITCLVVGVSQDQPPIVDTLSRPRRRHPKRSGTDGLLPGHPRRRPHTEHNFILDGDYTIKVKLLKSTVDLPFGGTAPDVSLKSPSTRGVASITINPKPKEAPKPPSLMSQRTSGASIPPPPRKLSLRQPPDSALPARVPKESRPANRHRGLSSKDMSYALAEDHMRPFERSTFDPSDPKGLPHVLSVSIAGPFNAAGSGETPSRQRIFVCHPAAAKDELPCAKKIISTLARRAYRRPITDNDVETLLNFYQSGKNSGTFETGIEMALRRILASPQFVYRFERDPAYIAPATLYRISDLEMASRLSFFLWSSLPDDQLLTAAAQGKLRDPALLEQQVKRMLADPRSESLVNNFAAQWLYLRNLRGVVPDLEAFPNFDDNLRQSFRRETELFFESILREDQNVLRLLDANYTFVNERLAHHYGIPNVYGSHFRRVAVNSDARRGLLGQGSILTVTLSSHPHFSRPTRQVAARKRPGHAPQSPPANVLPLKENAAG